MKILPLKWSRDAAGLRHLDTSFEIRHILELKSDGMSNVEEPQSEDESGAYASYMFILKECSPPRIKQYDITLDEKEADEAIVVLAGYVDNELSSIASVRYEEWNRRAVLNALYVHQPLRRKGYGRIMLKAVFDAVSLSALAITAKRKAIRHLWVETQNVNVPAIRFYQSMGFNICGWDKTLYDAPHEHEIAIYMAREVG